MLQNRSEVQTVFLNASTLFIIQIANQLLPFVLIPYLTHILGQDLYGTVAFGLAIVQIGSIITDYGFNLSITPLISSSKKQVTYVNRLIGAVLLSKVGLLFFVCIGIIIFITNADKFASHSSFLLLMCFPLIAQTFQPVWFFQGIEKMAYITIFTLASRVAYLLSVFAFVKSPEDYVWIPIANGGAHLIATILAFALMLKEGYRPVWPGLTYALRTAGHSTQYFWSRAAVSTYTAGGAFYLGLVSTSGQVALYSVAEQLYKGAQSMFMPLVQALYPNMARTRNFSMLFSIIKWSIVICLCGALFGAYTGDWFIKILFGAEYVGAHSILIVFMVTLCFSVPSVLLGYPFLGALGHSKAANGSVLVAGVIQILLLVGCFIFSRHSALDVAFTVCLVEILVFLIRVKWGSAAYKTWLLKAGHNQHVVSEKA